MSWLDKINTKAKGDSKYEILKLDVKSKKKKNQLSIAMGENLVMSDDAAPLSFNGVEYIDHERFSEIYDKNR